MDWDIIISVISWIILAAFFLSNTLYCKVFEREDVKNYNYLINLPITSFERIKFHKFQHTFQIKEKPEWIIILKDEDKEAWVTSRNYSSCILTSFYKRGSKKLYKKLTGWKM